MFHFYIYIYIYVYIFTYQKKKQPAIGVDPGAECQGDLGIGGRLWDGALVLLEHPGVGCTTGLAL